MLISAVVASINRYVRSIFMLDRAKEIFGHVYFNRQYVHAVLMLGESRFQSPSSLCTFFSFHPCGVKNASGTTLPRRVTQPKDSC